MRRRVKRWKSAPSRPHNKVGDAAVLYKTLKVKLVEDEDKSRIEDFDLFPPTCSSSEDHDRISPPNEPTFKIQEPSDDFVRFRGNSLGSAVRELSPRREIQLNHISYNGPEKSADAPILSALPPRAPIRNGIATASLRSRPPPPPYTAGGRQKPPPYPGRNTATSNSSACSTPLPSSFVPQSASTPKSDKGSPVKECDRPVVAEGEKRTFVREKSEFCNFGPSIIKPSKSHPAHGAVAHHAANLGKRNIICQRAQ
ncbi:unnamed protein product [Strongylus vulgaris]|uniref:Uncharacterized protein n=1 Tax=Strongylus vulgaris TaxID=40348 RepID=A0A3P7JEX5_STRVU|nr:unnamed protein product [Strongylus vulgaris]